MKLLTFKQNGCERLGVCAKGGIYALDDYGIKYNTMTELIKNITEEEMQIISSACENGCKDPISFDTVEKSAPIPKPEQDILCLGINYMAHAEESARYKKEAFGGDRTYAVYFSKRVNEAIADGDFIPAHEDIVERLDYEAELAVIIKKDALNVSMEDAKDYVFGYTVINDVSARDLQTRHTQWYFGKSLDGFTPMGPWIVTADEFNFPPHLNICSRVNGELRQNSNTNLLIFGIDHVISELSQGMTLKAGTVIAMGTPSGVGMGFVPPKFLKTGDVVECEVEGIGCIRNTIK